MNTKKSEKIIMISKMHLSMYAEGASGGNG